MNGFTTEEVEERIRSGDRRFVPKRCTVDGCQQSLEICGECGDAFDPIDGFTHSGGKHKCRACLNQDWHTPTLEDFLYQTSAFAQLGDEPPDIHGAGTLRRQINRKSMQDKGMEMLSPWDSLHKKD